MSKRIKKSWFVAGAALLAAGITASVAMRPTANLGLEASAVAAPAAGTPVDMEISRGSYLVNQVAMCGDCHTPMNQNGRFIKSKWLQGAKIAFKPNFPVRHWPHGAPNIAGLPWRWNAGAMIKFLTTGRDPRGHYAGPPMPAYRMNHADATVLLCATELFSLHFQQGWNTDNVLPNALFADGSAAIVGKPAAPGENWTCQATGSYLLPESNADMTWRIGDHGFQMTLSRRVPTLIAENLRPWLEQFLATHNLTIADIGSWAVHPGGPGILDAVRTSLSLPADALDVSRAVLADCGNMSSPTILFIVERLRQKSASLPCMMLAFGPGLAIEAALLI